MPDQSSQNNPGRVIALDGPAGSGKSTVAGLVAEKIGFIHADSGAIYRTLTLGFMRRVGEDVPPAEFATAVAPLLVGDLADIGVSAILRNGKQVNLLNGQDPGADIRTAAVTSRIKTIADAPACRHAVNRILREFSASANLVCDGRDMGTVVFPDASAKFFLEASIRVRALRRLKDFEGSGRTVALEDLEAEIAARDKDDRARPFGALVQAPDAILIDTTPLNLNDVVALILAHLQVHF
ncbi:MAG: (d)CMP kinase [Spirochaetia bacterium]|nr:(d)CMP kinase [Spirochaetia bacterium]